MSTISLIVNMRWDKVFKNEPGKICGRQPFKIWRDIRFVEDSLSKSEEIWSAVSRPYPSNFLKAVSYTFYLVHCWVLCIKWLFSYARLRRSLASVYHWGNKNPMLLVISNNLLNSIHYSYVIDVIFLNFFYLILSYTSVFQCAWNHWGS